MSLDWDCWIGDENGSARVYLADEWQPYPIPEPQYEGNGSAHKMIDGAQGGKLKTQSGSNDPGVLPVNLPYTTPEIKEAIEALYLRFVDGRKPAVQFFNSRKTYKCAWVAESFKPERRGLAPLRYSLNFRLTILSIVEAEDP